VPFFLHTLELSTKSPYLQLVFGPPFSAFTHYPLFQWYLQIKEIFKNLSMKSWNPVFNAQGSRLILVIVRVGEVKIYVAAMEAPREKER